MRRPLSTFSTQLRQALKIRWFSFFDRKLSDVVVCTIDSQTDFVSNSFSRRNLSIFLVGFFRSFFIVVVFFLCVESTLKIERKRESYWVISKQHKIHLNLWNIKQKSKENKMQLLKTTKCCGCMDLRTGGLVIGYISLFGTFINLEAPDGVGIGPFGMCINSNERERESVCVTHSVFSSKLSMISFVFMCFSGQFAGKWSLDLRHHQCKSI